MAEVNQVVKKTKVDKWDIIKFQLTTYCFFNKLSLSNADLDCIILLAMSDDLDELNTICIKVCDMNIFKTPQSVRNSLNKMEKKGILVKSGKGKKKLVINPDIGLIKEGNILLNYNLLCIETN
jgi:hypothetical protein